MTDLPFVVAGEWHDTEWCTVAAKARRTPAEALLYAGGARPHPWGMLAYISDEQPNGKRLIFPSKVEHDKHFGLLVEGEAVAEPVEAPPETEITGRRGKRG